MPPKSNIMSALAAALGTTPNALLGREPMLAKPDGLDIGEFDLFPSAMSGVYPPGPASESQASFTGLCPAAMAFKALGMRPGPMSK